MPTVTVVNPIPRSGAGLADSAASTIEKAAPILIVGGLLVAAFKVGSAEIPSIEAAISNRLTTAPGSAAVQASGPISGFGGGSLASSISSAVNPTTPNTPPSSVTNGMGLVPGDVNALYQTYVGRAATPSELARWTGQPHDALSSTLAADQPCLLRIWNSRPDIRAAFPGYDPLTAMKIWAYQWSGIQPGSACGAS